jgi:hypothetical protein
MVAVATKLVERAEDIFTDLGYTVSGEGAELRAERKWRVVRVTVLDEAEDVPERGDLRCFVAPERRAETLMERVLALAPDYDWAIISVDGDSYEVLHPPVGSLA